MWMTEMKYVLVGLVLLCNAVSDIRKKEIMLKSLAAGGILCLVQMCWERSVSVADCMAGMGIGGFLIFISVITKEQIGIGDGLVFLFTGLALGFWENLFLAMYSLAAVFVYMLVLYARKGIRKEQRVAFIPFVCIGYVGVLCL